MNRKITLVLALLSAAAIGPDATADGFIYIGGGPRPHHHHGPYGRPVYVRRIYPRPYVYEVPVYVERPMVVERQVVVERPVVVAPARTKIATQPSTVRQAQSVQPILPDSTQPTSSTESLKLVPIGPADAPPEPAPDVTVEHIVEQPKLPPLEFDGHLPPGPTTDFTVVHPRTGIQYVFPVPACEPEDIDPGRWETEIEYEDGEIEVEFKRDGRVKVKYEFDDD